MFLEQNYSKFGLVAFFFNGYKYSRIILLLHYSYEIHIISLEKLSIRVFGL